MSWSDVLTTIVEVLAVLICILLLFIVAARVMRDID